MRTAMKLLMLMGGGLPTYTIAQSTGAELLTDGGFEIGIASWSTIAGATLTNPAGTRTGGSGSKIMRIARNASNNPGAFESISGVSGDVHRLSGWAQGDGTFLPQFLRPTAFDLIQALLATNSWQPFDVLFQMDANGFSPTFRANATSAGFIELDDLSETKITTNPQITAPSADMRISQYYTLAASPVVGSQIWVMPRISNFASGNYWLVLLTFNTSSQWDITLFSVAASARTSRTSAANIGTTNGIRINCNGNLLDLQTTADNGQNWTTRGSQVNNALYNTATGVNTIYSPNNTIGRMTYESAV